MLYLPFLVVPTMRQEDHAKVSKSLAASYRLSHNLAAAAPKLLLASPYIYAWLVDRLVQVGLGLLENCLYKDDRISR